MMTQSVNLPVAARRPPLPVNPDLVWDYDIPPKNEQSEAFCRWYVTRVLTRGQADDLKAIGFDIIHSYLPTLNLLTEIRQFWEWYFNLPQVRQRYGNTHPSTTSDVDSNRSNAAGT